MEFVGYLYDGVEIITVEFMNKLNELRKKYATFGIGVYTDRMFTQIYGRMPLRPYEEREKLASAFKGVDFTFPVDSFECEIKKNQRKINEVEGTKLYHVGYAPGTYDILHEGHLEHLSLCRRMCDILVVGVKTDKNVFETKGKKTYQEQELRKTVIQNLEMVDYVIFVDTRDKRVANQEIQRLVGSPIDVVFLGSDCMGQENDQNPDNIRFIYTDRPEEVMKTRSSSFYRAELEKIHKEAEKK